jgi:proteasome lid subunit RPN8/RPN11
VIYLTQGLQETLLRLAREREPDAVTIALAVTPAGDLPAEDPALAALGDDVPVFTHFYLPRDDDSVSAVFGVDLGTPVGQTQGRFVSHPQGDLSLSTTDDLHEVVFVAVPPWDADSLAAFDRSGRRVELTVLDVEPPTEGADL